MRIEYGLSTTSLSSLLKETMPQNSKNLKDASDTNNNSVSEEMRTSNTHAVKNTLEDQTLDVLDSALAVMPNEERQTFGLEILEKMSDEEYEAFERASAGMSDVEKMAAAQALYVFTDFYKQYQENDNTEPHDNVKIQKNPYFNSKQDFIKRYKAFYNGAQEVNILS